QTTMQRHLPQRQVRRLRSPAFPISRLDHTTSCRTCARGGACPRKERSRFRRRSVVPDVVRRREPRYDEPMASTWTIRALAPSLFLLWCSTDPEIVRPDRETDGSISPNDAAASGDAKPNDGSAPASDAGGDAAAPGRTF